MRETGRYKIEVLDLGGSFQVFRPMYEVRGYALFRMKTVTSWRVFKQYTCVSPFYDDEETVEFSSLKGAKGFLRAHLLAKKPPQQRKFFEFTEEELLND